MNLIADGLLMATATIAGLYCLVLSRRLRRLTDSSSGIGSQIAALDRALAETRAALTETRDGVSELRASARAAIAELKRRTERAEEAASGLGEATRKADSVLQRLYEADGRIEGLTRRDADSDSSLPRPRRNGEERPSQPAVVLEVGDADGGCDPGEGPAPTDDDAAVNRGPGAERASAPDDSRARSERTDDAASAAPKVGGRGRKRNGGGIGA